jgi:hypothetical protein
MAGDQRHDRRRVGSSSWACSQNRPELRFLGAFGQSDILRL